MKAFFLYNNNELVNKKHYVSEKKKNQRYLVKRKVNKDQVALNFTRKLYFIKHNATEKSHISPTYNNGFWKHPLIKNVWTSSHQELKFVSSSFEYRLELGFPLANRLTLKW